MIAGDDEFMIMMLHYVPQYSLGLILFSLCASYNEKSSLTPSYIFFSVGTVCNTSFIMLAQELFIVYNTQHKFRCLLFPFLCFVVEPECRTLIKCNDLPY